MRIILHLSCRIRAQHGFHICSLLFFRSCFLCFLTLLFIQIFTNRISCLNATFGAIVAFACAVGAVSGLIILAVTAFLTLATLATLATLVALVTLAAIALTTTVTVPTARTTITIVMLTAVPTTSAANTT